MSNIMDIHKQTHDLQKTCRSRAPFSCDKWTLSSQYFNFKVKNFLLPYNFASKFQSSHYLN